MALIGTWEPYLVVDTTPEHANNTASILLNITVRQQEVNEWNDDSGEK